MKKLILASSIFLLIGCASVSKTDAIKNIDTVLKTEQMTEPVRLALVEAKKNIVAAEKIEQQKTWITIGKSAVAAGFVAVFLLAFFVVRRLMP